jgi:hypothetical protein
MFSTLTRLEAGLFAGLAAAVAVALWGPHVAQDAHFHAFADQRVVWGIPNALDVLSNLPFLVGGGWGLWVLQKMPNTLRASTQWKLCAVFFAGLLLTALASGYYHLQPDDLGLAWDRLGMVVAFAGLAGLAAADRVSGRAGLSVALVVLLAGPIGILVWRSTGNLLAWSVVQGGGMLLVLALGCCKPLAGAWRVSLALVIGIYVAAKLCEFADVEVFELTRGWLSGHSLKHMVAAVAAWPVLLAVLNHDSQKAKADTSE